MSVKIITWNGLPSTVVPGLVIGQVRRSLIGKPRGTRLEIPGRPGFHHFSQPPGSRKLVAECFIEGSSFQNRRDAFEDLADWLDVEFEAPLIVSDTPGIFYRAVIEDSGDSDEWREFGTFELVWEVQPYSFDNSTTVETWDSGIDTLHEWESGLKAMVYPIIEVRPTNGTLTSFTLETNGSPLNFVGNVVSGATVTINSLAAVVLSGVNTDIELTGAYDPTALIMSGISGTFPELIPGENSVRFLRLGGTATNISIKVTYRKTYRK